jgi:hypothetical protein
MVNVKVNLVTHEELKVLRSRIKHKTGKRVTFDVIIRAALFTLGNTLNGLRCPITEEEIVKLLNF